MTDFKIIILGIVAVIDILFAALILLKGKKRRESTSFGLFVFMLAIWTFGLFMFYRALDPVSSLFWAKTLYFAGSCTAIFFFFFAFNFPQKQPFLSWRKIILTFIPVPLLFVLYFCSNLIIAGTLITEKGFVYGPLRLAFDIPFYAYFLSAFAKLFISYKKYTDVTHFQLRYIVFSSFPALIIAAITNVILLWFGVFNYIWLGPSVSLILITASTYAIIRYQLMDIRIIVRKSTIYLIIAGFVYACFYGVVWLLSRWFGGIYNQDAMIFGIFLAFAFVFAFIWFEKLVRYLANRYFFNFNMVTLPTLDTQPQPIL